MTCTVQIRGSTVYTYISHVSHRVRVRVYHTADLAKSKLALDVPVYTILKCLCKVCLWFSVPQLRFVWTIFFHFFFLQGQCKLLYLSHGYSLKLVEMQSNNALHDICNTQCHAYLAMASLARLLCGIVCFQTVPCHILPLVYHCSLLSLSIVCNA